MIGIDRHRGELPPVNTRVDVHGRWNRWVPSRVEDRDDQGLLLAAPATADFTIEPRLGDTVEIQWITRRGLGQVSGVVEGIRQENALRLWRVRTMVEPTVHQRRRYVRAQVVIPAVVERPRDDDRVERIHASTVDVSEGGIQLVTQPPDVVAKGAFVVVEVEIDGARLRLGGDVLQSRNRDEGGQSIVVRFLDVKDADADRIRRFVFASQMTSLVREGV